MSAIDELNHHPGVHGVVAAAIRELDARLSAVEAHKQMLTELDKAYAEHLQMSQAPAEDLAPGPIAQSGDGGSAPGPDGAAGS